MSAQVKFADVEVGTEIPEATYPIDRLTLVKYAGASGDFNTIHWNERIATEVGLPNVIAHGMFTMATAVRVVTDWVGDPGAVIDPKSVVMDCNINSITLLLWLPILPKS